jgi:hypothetical protein
MLSLSKKSKTARPKQTRRPVLEALEGRLAPANLFVNSAADSGANTLRDAITTVNTDTTPGVDNILLNIGGFGVVTKIQLMSPLPALSRGSVTIDGTVELGYNGSPLVVLDGTNAGGLGSDGLTLGFKDDIVKGLAIENFSGSGVLMTSAGFPTTDNLVQANNISHNAVGVEILDFVGEPNLIFGNLVQGNSISNNGTGVLIGTGATNNTIGGTAAGDGNTISGNTADGVDITGGTTGNLVQGNFIGTDATGTTQLPNKGDGVLIHNGASGNTIGGTGSGNIIAYNMGAGVQIGDPTFADNTTVDNAVRANAIFGNVGPGIVLGTGVTNTTGGPHTGPNDLQNYPVLNSYTTPGVLTGTLNSTPNSTFQIDFFANPAADPTGFGQGRDFLGSLSVSTNALGNVSFTFSFTPFPGEPVLTATATDPSGNTSEFSTSVDAVLTPSGQSLPATEGAAFSGVVATFTDADPSATAASFSAAVAWGDGESSAGSVVSDPRVAGRFNVLASKPHPYAEEGSQAVTVTITDLPSNTQVSAHSTAVVAALVAPSAPLSVQAAESSLFTGAVAAFTDGAPASAAGAFTAVVAWGDGSSAGTVLATAGGFQVLGSHSYAEEGNYALTITALGSDGTTATASGTATVADAALTPLSKTVAFTEGAAGTGVVASFEDTDPHGFTAEYSATIGWGDNTTSPGTITADGVGFDVTGSHAYAEEGAYSVSVTIKDPGGAGATANSTANVADAPLTATGVPRFAVIGGQQFTHLMATFTDGDPAGTVNDYSASIAWGDGTSSAGTIGTSASGFTVTGTHTYPAGSGANFVPVVTVKDSGGSMSSATDSIHDPTRNQLFVLQLYQDLLGREADAAGLASWSGQLDSGATTRTQVAGAIAGSMEYRSDEVQALYQHYLHRPADPSGLATFVGFLDSGGTVEQMAAIIVGSPEYYAVRGGNTTTGFLTALYQDALNRLPDAAGAAVFTQALGQGLSRAQLAAAVFSSVEYRQDLVQADYLAWLNRPADPAALNGFTAALASGLRDEVLTATLLGSDEFFSKLGSSVG